MRHPNQSRSSDHPTIEDEKGNTHVHSASEAIVDAAEELNVDLIVLGSRGLRGFKATLLGSTSANVLHHATRPTLVIPADAVAVARRRNRDATPKE